jgi:hypothetical protein
MGHHRVWSRQPATDHHDPDRPVLISSASFRICWKRTSAVFAVGDVVGMACVLAIAFAGRLPGGRCRFPLIDRAVDTTIQVGRMMMQMFGAFAEFERGSAP